MKAISRSIEYYDTLRDELAGKAMQSFLLGTELNALVHVSEVIEYTRRIARMSYLVADSMLDSRNL